jgi:hypothetical protein
MKKYFEVIGFVTLAIFSFYFTSKTSTVIKNTDNIMIKIKEDMNNMKTDPVDAIIDDDTIIPGISGREVDISKSYDVMKKIGTYKDNLLVYKKIKPNISISNIYNKYIISGNPNRNQVTLIFKVDESNLNLLMSILKENRVRANIFTVDKMDDSILSLVREGHNIGTISNSTWASTLVDKIANQKYNYCYLEEEDKEVLDICSMNKSYTVIPSIITKSTPTLTIKKDIKSGSIISMDVNKTLLKELEYIIKYIKFKGYDIVTLETLLDE